ncbi:LptA/OstA family protein [Pectinatus frisingensis]|uniref:LptA/OstA family protein n=1 Tax=Pectinatus frisingensis TaxID=865 RepID=UPI0018C535A2|nr:LptA/OstA family protein [Pectinatus frisingensis]
MRILKTSLFLLAIMLFSTYTVFAAPKVTADNTTFDILSGTYKLNGNVRVETGRYNITADRAQVNLTSLEVWAQKNITCIYNGDDNATPINFTGDDLYGSWSNKTITVKGGTHFTYGDLSIDSDQASFNWETKIVDFTGNVIVQQNGKTTKYSDVKYNVIDKKFINDTGNSASQ